MNTLRLKDYIIKLFGSHIYKPCKIGERKCPICDSKNFYDFHKEQVQDKFFDDVFVCLKCGPYTYKEKAKSGANLIDYFPMSNKKIPNYNLSSYLRHRFENRRINNISDFNDIINIENIENEDTLDSLIESASANIPKFSERQYYLLRALESLQEDLGEKIYLDNNNTHLKYIKKTMVDSGLTGIVNNYNPILLYDKLVPDEPHTLKNYLISFSYLKKYGELKYCLEGLHDAKYINLNYKKDYKKDDDDTIETIEILPSGYIYIENHGIKNQTKSDKVFIAMNFKEENNDLWEAIENTLRNYLGYDAVRLDKKPLG